MGLLTQEAITTATVAQLAHHDTKKIIRTGVITILLAFGGFGSWATLAPLHGAVMAAGQVKVESSRKTIQHLEGGIVSQILVKEGQLVKKDEPLIVLESTQIDAQLNMVGDQLDIQLGAAARLEAEKAGANSLKFSPALLAKSKMPTAVEIMQNETALFNVRRQALNSELSLIQGQVAEIKGEIVALNSQLAATDKTIGYLDEELAVNEKLAKQGFVANPRLLEFKRSLSAQQDRKGEYFADIARAKQKINELGLRAANLRHEYSTRANTELKATQDKIFDLQERLRVPQDAMQRQTIVSPVAGRIVGLKVHTIGGVIGAREPLMDVAPELGDLLIESRVQTSDIDDLHLGMEAEVRLSAYKQRTTPLVKGKVINIGADSLIDEATHIPYYSVQVKVDAPSLKEAGDDIKLYPGMPAEVYLLTQSRTAFQYLIDPITDTLHRSFRES
ncbi:MAG: HlyD family type I secretion periplasmic adaptor subunit [Methylotenera sp.]|nr:HlyD family type I secretion periplasmic adaptor subunit [Methylotenera sp.]